MVASADEGRRAAWEGVRPAARLAAGGHAAFLVALTIAASAPGVRAQEAPGGAATGAAGGQAPDAGGGPAPGATGGQTLGAGGGREWTIVPAISGIGEFTDNALMTPTHRQSDFLTIISPSLYINGDTPRFTGSLGVSPQITEHSTVTSQNQVTANVLGSGTLTAVPDRLFLDAHASTSEVSRVGGLGYGNQAQIPTSQSTQTTAYSASPYAKFHFGDTGDAVVTYLVGQTLFSGNTGAIAGPVAGTTLGSISDSTQQDASARFTTGEAFGRLQLSASADYSIFSSASSLSSTTSTLRLDNTYQVSESWFAIGGVGYERLNYTVANAATSNGVIWNAGARYQPREDRQVVLTYGKAAGQYGFNGSMLYPLTPLATLNASYAQQTTTGQQQLLQNLQSLTQLPPGSTINPLTGLPVTVTNPNGLLIDPRTGLPASLQNPNLALQNSVLRTKTLQVSVTMVGNDRNTYSLTFNRTESNAVTVGGLSQTTTGGYAVWNRDISPSTQGSLSGGYSTTSSGASTAGGTSNISTINLGAGLSYALSDTLSTGVNYALLREGGAAGGSILENLITFSINKRF